jgi:5'-deoxynucleotidase YfbR-like HD superfamily hydrolase
MKKLSLIDFFIGHHRRLAKVIRYSTRIRSFDESVSTHTFFVVLYTAILSDILIKKGIEVDKSKAMTRALVHDLAEQTSGDIIRTFKADLPEAFNRLEEISVNKSLQTLPEELKNEYSENWQKMFDDLEGLIVKVADDISGLMYCYESIKMGNQYFYGIYQHYFDRLMKEIKGTKLEFLKKEFKKLNYNKRIVDGT